MTDDDHLYEPSPHLQPGGAVHEVRETPVAAGAPTAREQPTGVGARLIAVVLAPLFIAVAVGLVCAAFVFFIVTGRSHPDLGRR